MKIRYELTIKNEDTEENILTLVGGSQWRTKEAALKSILKSIKESINRQLPRPTK